MYTVWTIFTKRCLAYRKSKVSTKWEGPILRARGADFQEEKWRGELMQMCKHEQTRGVGGRGGTNANVVSMSKLEGSGGMLSQGNFKFKSSEMATNASKPANSNANLLIITSTLKLTSYNLAPTLD